MEIGKILEEHKPLDQKDYVKIKELLNRKEVDANDIYDGHPLIFNALMLRNPKDRHKVLNMLLEYNANPNIFIGPLPITFYAVRDPKSIELLLSFGANPRSKARTLSLLDHCSEDLKHSEFKDEVLETIKLIKKYIL